MGTSDEKPEASSGTGRPVLRLRRGKERPVGARSTVEEEQTKASRQSSVKKGESMPVVLSSPGESTLPEAGVSGRWPVVPLRDAVVFPRMLVPLMVGRQRSANAIDTALSSDEKVVLIAQKNPKVDQVGEDDIYRIGTLAKIEGARRALGGGLQILVEGLARVRIEQIQQVEPYMSVDVVEVPDVVPPGVEMAALVRSVQTLFETYVQSGASVAPDVGQAIAQAEDPSYLADLAASVPDMSREQRQQLLEMPNVADRLHFISDFLVKQNEVLALTNKIQSEVRSTLDKAQREHILREQLRAIRKELGEDEGEIETKELREKILTAGMPEDVEKRALKELDRLTQLHSASPEVGVIRTYLDWLISLPWKEPEPEQWDIQTAQRVLDEDHYGLSKVKDRILEFMAVRQRVSRVRSPILCFTGPPGVGKTSLGRSIARAMGRKFVRISLGGIRDEAEIRGHRRTYVGALPGRIIQSMKTAGTRNPVFILDEIDKIGVDFRGDPSSALLEVLDPEQNREFSDHYLEVPYDLSQVLFITTANLVDTISGPLRDRMEVIRLPGYTEEEKIRIAEQYLVPRQLTEHGLTTENLEITHDLLRTLVREYTREAGVRNLEREIANIARKIPRRIAEGRTEKLTPTAADLTEMLGPPRYDFGELESEDRVGAVTGVSVSEYGGDVMTVEAILLDGKQDFLLTGQIGKVMEESAKTALSYIRAHARRWNIDVKVFEEKGIHVHVPAGAIPKDGPSAGITMATAIASALTGRPVARDIAMTGEITLHGKVLPIGGVKEKLLAAHRAGIRTFLLPTKNVRDTTEVPPEVKREMEIVAVESVDQVLKLALRDASLALPPPSGAINDGADDRTPSGERRDTDVVPAEALGETSR
jgi:ATP-dependent Lon protease